MDSQRVVTHESAARIGDVELELAAKWTTREQTYVKLVQDPGPRRHPRQTERRLRRPRVDDLSPEIVKGTRHRYVSITSPVQTDLLAIVRHDLRPAPIKPTPPKGAAQSRLDFEAALRHRPGDPGPSVAM